MPLRLATRPTRTARRTRAASTLATRKPIVQVEAKLLPGLVDKRRVPDAKKKAVRRQDAVAAAKVILQLSPARLAALRAWLDAHEAEQARTDDAQTPEQRGQLAAILYTPRANEIAADIAD